MDNLSYYCIPSIENNALPLLVLSVTEGRKEGREVGRKGGRKEKFLGKLDAISAPPGATMKSTVLSFVFSASFIKSTLGE